MSQEEKIKKLFEKISGAIEEEEHEEVIELSDKILALSKDNNIAKECKMVALIHNGDYQDALSEMNKYGSHSALAKSYCLFRLEKYEEALKELKDDKDIGNKQLLGQIYFKLEDEKSLKYFEEISKEKDIDDETKTNIIANLVQNKRYIEGYKFKNNNFESLYNIGCCYIGENKYDEAIKILKEAKNKCLEIGKKEELEQEDIEYDLAIINIQIGYCYQMKEENEESKEYYTKLITSKIQDLSSRSIARNNLLVLRGNKDLFDSLKQMKLSNSKKSLSKLNSFQKRKIKWNYCLLLMNMDSNKECLEILENLMKQEEKEEEEEFIILLAALKSKEKKFEEGVEILNSFLKKSPNSINSKLFLSQMHLTKGNIEDCLNILLTLDNKFEPSILSSIISLMNRLGQNDQIKILNDASIYWENKNEQEKLKIILLESAKLKLKLGLFKDASNDFEKLVKIDSSNQIYISGLIKSLSEFDIEKSENISKLLPLIQFDNIDIDKLESQNISDFMRSNKKSLDLDIEDDDSNQQFVKKKRIKKKKQKNRNQKLEEKFSKKKKKKVTGTSKSAQGSQTRDDQSKYETKLGQKKKVDASAVLAGKKKKKK
eukprot:gene1057-10576_t